MFSEPSWNCSRMKSCGWSMVTGSVPLDTQRQMCVHRTLFSFAEPPGRHDQMTECDLQRRTAHANDMTHGSEPWRVSMPPPGLQNYLVPRMTLTFNLLTPKLIVSCPSPVDHLALKWFTHFQKTVFTNLVTDRWTDGWRGGEHNASACQSDLHWRECVVS